MGKKAFVLCTILFLSAILFASAGIVCDKADKLYWADSYEESQTVLLEALPASNDPIEKAEILWRLSRVTLGIGDELNETNSATKDELFAIYEKAQAYAEEAIALHSSADAILWKASSIGRWGETKGPLNSLVKAKGMKIDLATIVDDLGVLDNSEAWYVLGQLYYQLPGSPISFGNLEAGISYTRRAVDTIPANLVYPNHFVALAKMLWKRNWSASTRDSKISTMQKEWNKKKDGNLAKYWFYEGANGPGVKPFYSPVALNKMSDRQEAVMVLQYGKNKYNAWAFHSRGDKRGLETIDMLLKEYGF
ncbi:MAG: hypothetical protein AB9828_09905 [Sphaerochaetaceae bacterium]